MRGVGASELFHFAEGGGAARRAGRHPAPSGALLRTGPDRTGPERDGDWWLLPTMANRQPTAASYLRRPGDTEFRSFKFDVARVTADTVAGSQIVSVHQFPRIRS